MILASRTVLILRHSVTSPKSGAWHHGCVSPALRILACTIPGAEARLRAALPDAGFQFVFTTAEALAALKPGAFDLLILGMRFDESRALEFLQRVRENASLEGLPVVGIRGAARPAVISPQHFDLPMWAMGARDVIDFSAIPSNEAGDRHVRERLLRCAGHPP